MPMLYITLANATLRNATFVANFERRRGVPVIVTAPARVGGRHLPLATNALRALSGFRRRHACRLRGRRHPRRQFAPEKMDALLSELQAKGDDWDMAYMGTNMWGWGLMNYAPPWHRYTSHTLDKAWAQLHAVIYSRVGLQRVLPILEARLRELETPNPDGTFPEAEHVDLYLESKRPDLRRHQVVPYMFDQNWTIETENVDRCHAENMKTCGDSALDPSQTFIQGCTSGGPACYEA